ncbi:recombination protein RecR [candidate division Kazan bacterium RIFCSPHIGHO2_01_FULL_49_10]|uniref:Recombination protein RecR n=1 Tax=candidate division Kazan bacterium RIFCSPLOWO2_01_FULL_48_13 TaxID=1798539 RepID=A0A1F4PN35_UNCK3|nr:MAG: recombination protein RecR [candidate division Kazan bacterium RIFCSPHIGHO2_01_FULL_49_10]OGB85253.1 MAG: recombination protein RecR [candidate division Kazan bacterium RIFCSPLOWO2_01_FULL_48_13]
MYTLPKSVSRLITELSRLPGVGPKTASRLAFYLIRNQQSDVTALGEALLELRSNLVYCDACHNVADSNPCGICADPERDGAVLCVVEEPLDVLAIERSRSFNGKYHVLGGRLSPLDGISAESLQLSDLPQRVGTDGIKEVIIATNHNVEGEATAMYIQKIIASTEVRVTRIASGLPQGGDLEYADEVTLARALEGRRLA